MSKKHHRKKDRIVARKRMEAPPDYSALMPEETEPDASMETKRMPIDSILAQLSDLKDLAASLQSQRDGPEPTQSRVAACEAATAILSALQDEGVADAERVKDLIFDYELSQKEIRELHRKFIEPASVKVRMGHNAVEQHCPECDTRLPTSVFYRLNHCEICGKRIMRPSEASRRRDNEREEV